MGYVGTDMDHEYYLAHYGIRGMKWKNHLRVTDEDGNYIRGPHRATGKKPIGSKGPYVSSEYREELAYNTRRNEYPENMTPVQRRARRMKMANSAGGGNRSSEKEPGIMNRYHSTGANANDGSRQRDISTSRRDTRVRNQYRDRSAREQNEARDRERERTASVNAARRDHDRMESEGKRNAERRMQGNNVLNSQRGRSSSASTSNHMQRVADLHGNKSLDRTFRGGSSVRSVAMENWHNRQRKSDMTGSKAPRESGRREDALKNKKSRKRR